jgi:hypothetical protein
MASLSGLSPQPVARDDQVPDLVDFDLAAGRAAPIGDRLAQHDQRVAEEAKPRAPPR